MRLTQVHLAVVVAAVLALGISGCGGDGDAPLAAAAQIDADAPPLHSFDIYALGSDAGNELFADIYGITLNPLRAFRLTAEKRVSWLSASADTIAVAAADQQADKLALVADGGVMAPWPGLGRPHAFAPEIQPDGTIRYQDSGLGEKIISRYMSYDPVTERSRVLYRDEANIEIAAKGPDGTFLVVDHDLKRIDRVLVRDMDGKETAYPVAEAIGSPELGKSFISVPVYGASDPAAPANGVGLINLKTGKVRVVDGWAELGWTPDRTKILVGRGGPDSTELAVLDPNRPDQEPEILGAVPIKELYMASWVDRSS